MSKREEENKNEKYNEEKNVYIIRYIYDRNKEIYPLTKEYFDSFEEQHKEKTEQLKMTEYDIVQYLVNKYPEISRYSSISKGCTLVIKNLSKEKNKTMNDEINCYCPTLDIFIDRKQFEQDYKKFKIWYDICKKNKWFSNVE